MNGRAEFLVLKATYDSISEEDKNRPLTNAPFHVMTSICEQACKRPGDGAAYREMIAGLRSYLTAAGEVVEDAALDYMVKMVVFGMFLDKLRDGSELGQFNWQVSFEEVARRIAEVELCAMRGEAESHAGSVTMFRAIYGEGMTPVRSICTSATHKQVEIYTPPLSYWQDKARKPFCPLCGRDLTMGD